MTLDPAVRHGRAADDADHQPRTGSRRTRCPAGWATTPRTWGCSQAC